MWLGGAATLGAQLSQTEAVIRLEVRSEAGPLANAQVRLGKISVVTDRNGQVTLRMPPGPAVLQVQKEGFLPASTSLMLEAGKEHDILVELQAAPEVEEEIIVFATRTDRRLQDEPVRVEVLGREEIEEKMLMTPGDIVMMLNEMGGLRVQATSPSLGAASVRIQGMRGRYTRFLSDGLPLFGQQVGGLGLMQIPPMDLGQVEVIKGVASALYGAGGMGGVVNLVSRRPGKEPLVEGLLNFSSLGGGDAIVFASSPLGSRWSTTLLGSGHFQKRKDIDRDGWGDVASYQRGVFRPRFWWHDGKGNSVFLTAGFTGEERDGGTVNGAVLPSTGSRYPETLGTRRFDVGGGGHFLLSKSYVLTATGAAAHRRHRHRFGESLERDRHTTLFGELTVRKTVGRHTWVAGTALEYDRYQPQDLPQFGFSHRAPAVFVQDDFSITSWLAVAASARLDFHNQYGSFFSPRISVLLRTEGWSSRISAGQGFFAPTPLTEETEAAGLTRLSVAGPLRAERGRSASLDVTRSAGPGTYSVTLFFSHIRNPLRVEREVGYALQSQPGATTNHGVELLATLRRQPLAVTASYSYVRARQSENSFRADVPLTPRHSFALVAMWEKEKTGRLGWELYYTGRQRLEANPYRQHSPAYWIMGFLAEKRIGKFRLFLNAENLTDVRQTHWDPLLRPSRAPDGRWTVDAWAPLDGRAFNGGIRIHY
jgi:iron complex outermembrane receptor protein